MSAKSIMATLDRFEGEQAVLHFDDGQELAIAVELLPVDTAEGARITVSFLGNQDDEAARAENARAVLNEILQGE